VCTLPFSRSVILEIDSALGADGEAGPAGVSRLVSPDVPRGLGGNLRAAKVTHLRGV
jgi:hypothetical protein